MLCLKQDNCSVLECFLININSILVRSSFWSGCNMSWLVSYAVTSSDDDDDEDSGSRVSQEHGSAVFKTKLCRKNENDDAVSPDKIVNISHNRRELDKVTVCHTPRHDLPITDESDDQQSGNFINSDSENCSELPCLTKNCSELPCLTKNCSELPCSTKVTFDSCQSESVTIQPKNCSMNDSQIVTVTGDVANKVTGHLIPACQQVQMYSQTTSLGTLQAQTSHISVPKDESQSQAGTDIYSALSPHSEESHSFTRSSTESPSLPQPARSETTSCTVPNRKRKLSDDSKKPLDLPDSIQSMFLSRQHRWMDDPAQHSNRVRSFPHLEGNWATHVYIPVAKTEEFVRFVDELLAMLMPATFQAQPDFHVSLSRTVTIRYHWIELLVDSLREQFKSLTSCISDLTSVKLFTNDEKTRTFVAIELSPEDNREFLDYVRAVDKSFAEFKLPAYYENPSFHISVGWCVGDVTGHIPGEKLSKAQGMLGDFVAANSDLGFVYAHQVCCQTGCKSFVITLPDSGS